MVLDTDHEGWDINELLADSKDQLSSINENEEERKSGYIPDVSLTDVDTSLVNRLGESELEHESLETSLEDVGNTQTQHVIELVLVFRKNTIVVKTTQKSDTLEDSLGIVLVQSEKLTSGLSHLGNHKVDSPDLALVLETVLADELHLGIEALLLKRTSGGLESLTVVSGHGASRKTKAKKGRPKISEGLLTEIRTKIFPSPYYTTQL